MEEEKGQIMEPINPQLNWAIKLRTKEIAIKSLKRLGKNNGTHNL